MTHKIRLGPIAVFLAVIAAVVATLANLTFATSRADVALAERFAAVTAIRYELDEEGNRFLQELDVTMSGAARTGTAEEPDGNPESTEAGASVGGNSAEEIAASLSGELSSLAGGGWKYYTEKDGYALTVEVVPAETSVSLSEPEITGPAEEMKDGQETEAVSSVEEDRYHSSGRWQITKWKINKLWEGDDPFEDLWLG